MWKEHPDHHICYPDKMNLLKQFWVKVSIWMLQKHQSLWFNICVSFVMILAHFSHVCTYASYIAKCCWLSKWTQFVVKYEPNHAMSGPEGVSKVTLAWQPSSILFISTLKYTSIKVHAKGDNCAKYRFNGYWKIGNQSKNIHILKICFQYRVAVMVL